jgi:hypothetical protein
MLRGKDYKTVEPKCKEGNSPCTYGMLLILEKYFDNDSCTIEMDQINDWIKGGAATKLVEVAA